MGKGKGKTRVQAFKVRIDSGVHDAEGENLEKQVTGDLHVPIASGRVRAFPRSEVNITITPLVSKRCHVSRQTSQKLRGKGVSEKKI